MSFDIHGNDLIPGCCEVHPFIHEPYPCSMCLAEADREDAVRDQIASQEAEDYGRAMNDLYERDMEEQDRQQALAEQEQAEAEQ